MTIAPAPERVITLDGIRGVAVMGILLMNAAAFAMPFAAYENPANYGALAWPDRLMWAIQFITVDGKMRAIFSALFGASLLLITERSEAAGIQPARIHYGRMASLLLIGLAHACLIWEGDILVLYALVGAIAFRLRRLELEQMLVLAGLLLSFQFATLGLHYQALGALADAAASPGADPAVIGSWRNVLDTIGRPSPHALAVDVMLHHGPWRALVVDRIAREPGAIWAQLLFNGPETLGLMLLGMAGLRTGLFTGGWRRSACRRLVWIAYGIGLPILAGIAALLIARGFPPLLTAALSDLALPLRWLVAAGHVALLTLWFGGVHTRTKLRIAAAGRVALTNYIGTSLIMTGLFDGWGIGLYGTLPRWALLPVTIGIWLVMLLWSKLWLDHFAYGPLEWLWRLIARGQVPVFRRRAIAS